MATRPQDDPQPSPSTQYNRDENDVEKELKEDDNQNDKDLMSSGTSLDMDKELGRALTVEEFLMKSKTYMLEYEKFMFMDTIDSDCLVVAAK